MVFEKKITSAGLSVGCKGSFPLIAKANQNISKHSLRACELAFAMSGKEALIDV